MTGRVIVVGSINIDLVVTGPKLPAPGETVIGGRFAQHYGGKGGNQAVAAARLGAPVAFIGAVGDDDFGRSARDMLAAEGIDVSQIRTLADQATGVALILVDADGENSISVASGANGAVTPEQVAGSIAVLAPGPGGGVGGGRVGPTAGGAAERAQRLSKTIMTSTLPFAIRRRCAQST
jgi:ribokinase